MAQNVVTETTISLPFTIDNFGSISSANTQEKIWADRVRSVIGTTVTERIMNPDYGTKIPSTLFESEEAMSSIIKKEVSNSFINFLPLLDVNEVKIVNIPGSGIVEAEIVYTMPNEQVGTLSIGVAYLNGNLPIYEERA